ncbi:MAG: hypothetical protein LAO21_03635 [Acidobacteriia bacterium]|nr:hypothetical protein [Terriglobia bacterium]
MKSSALLLWVFSLWGMIGAIWVSLSIYRGVLGMHEEGRIFLFEGEEYLVRDQEELAERVERLSPYLHWSRTLGVTLTALLGILWFYRGWSGL